MRIGEAARQSGVTTKTIRYYGSIGLVAEPPREPWGYRSYGEGDVSRLRFIASAKQLGLTLDEIRDLLGASDQEEVSCPHLVELLEAKRNHVAGWIRDAEALHDALDRTIEASRDQIAAASSPVDCCPVIERGLHERAVLAAADRGESPVPLPARRFVRGGGRAGNEADAGDGRTDATTDTTATPPALRAAGGDNGTPWQTTKGNDPMATETTTLHLPALHCEGCMSTARRELERTGATVEASDMDAKRITVRFDSEQLSRENLETAMEAVGFPHEEEGGDGDGGA